MVNKKQFLFLGMFLVGVILISGIVSAWVDFSTVGGIKTVVNTLQGGTNWSLFNNSYNSSVVFVNVTFYNNHSGLAGQLDGIAFDNNSALEDLGTEGDANQNATILNATVYARKNESGATWTRVGVLTNWTVWGGALLNKSSVFGNLSISRTILTDGVYDFNVTITNSSNYNISIASLFNLSFNVTIENDPPVVYFNNITISCTYRGDSNLSVFAHGIRNYSGTLIINATVINPGANVSRVVLNLTNGTAKKVSYNKTLTREGSTEHYSASIDTSIYPDGFYNLSIVANGSCNGKICYGDETGLVNDTALIKLIYIDNTAPTATFTCTPSTVSSGSTETCTCSPSDVTTSVFSSYTTNPSTANTGSHTETCSVWDSAGNTYSKTATFIVELSGSGPSGGSAGPATSSTPSVSTSTTATEIAPGTPEVLSNFADTGVKEISVSVSATASDVSVSVDKYSKVPSAVGVAKEGEVYKYLKIDTENLEGKLDKAIITIQVAKSWVASKELTKEDIAMSKFVSGEWKELPTTFTSEDSNNYYYTVELTSFSYFAIGEKTGNVISEETPAETASGMGTTAWIIIAVVIVAIVAVAYFLMKKKK